MRAKKISATITSLVVTTGAVVFLGVWAHGDDRPEPFGEPLDELSEGADIASNGNVRKAIGEAGSLISQEGEAVFSLSLKNVEALESCPSRAKDLEPVQGTYLVAEAEVIVHSDVVDAAYDGAEVYFPMVADAFSIYDEQGKRVTNVHTVDAWECYEDDDLLPSFVFPGDHVSGYVVFDADVQSGTLAYMPGDYAGWQWDF